MAEEIHQTRGVEEDARGNTVDETRNKKKTSNPPPWELSEFERRVRSGEREEAVHYLLELLILLDRKQGSLVGDHFVARASGTESLDEGRRQVHYRLLLAISALLSDPELRISRSGARGFFPVHRWLGALFGASSFVNCDHVMQRFSPRGEEVVTYTMSKQDLPLFLVLLTLESGIDVDWDRLYEMDAGLTVAAALALLTPPICRIETGPCQKRAPVAMVAIQIGCHERLVAYSGRRAARRVHALQLCRHRSAPPH